jgi:hypothetical protein
MKLEVEPDGEEGEESAERKEIYCMGGQPKCVGPYDWSREETKKLLVSFCLRQ